MKVNTKKIEAIQGLRAIGFLCICSSHCELTRLGAFGVSIFFIMSGFLLTYKNIQKELSYSVKDSILFSLNKIKRLYLLHLLTTIAIVVGNYMLGMKIQWRLIAINTLLIQSWFPDMNVYFSLNGVSWYLSTCVFLYAFFPIILFLIKKTKNKMALAFGVYFIQVVIGIIINFLFFGKENGNAIIFWVTYICPLFRLGDLIIGSCLGYLYATCEVEKNNSFVVSIIELISVCLFFVIQYFNENNLYIWKWDFFRSSIGYTPIAATFVLLAALESGVISKLLKNKALVYIGNISGYAFLIHNVVIPFLKTFLIETFHIELYPTLLFLLTFIITCISSEIYIKIVIHIRKKLKYITN